MALRGARRRSSVDVPTLSPLLVVYFSFSLSLFVINVLPRAWPLRVFTGLVSRTILNKNTLTQESPNLDTSQPIDWEKLPKLHVREPQSLHAAQTPSSSFDRASVEKAAPFSGIVNDPPHVCQAYMDTITATGSKDVSSDSLPPACGYILRGDGDSNDAGRPPGATTRQTPIAEGQLTYS